MPFLVRLEPWFCFTIRDVLDLSQLDLALGWTTHGINFIFIKKRKQITPRLSIYTVTIGYVYGLIFKYSP